jgi:membrane-bound lytic murein transglycosylase B
MRLFHTHRPGLSASPVALFCAVLMLASCQSGPPHPPVAATPAPGAAAGATTPEFEAWLAGLKAEARTRGISQKTIAAALNNLAPIPRVLELDGKQPEFTQTFWRYFDGALTPKRIADGAAFMDKHHALLAKLESTYGVPGRFVVAFWGMETDYGRNMGGYPVVGALATLAFDGRRAAFFRTELFNALTIIDHGNISPAQMVGSWAGAMGQTQFMPSTYLKYAVDADNDHRIDIWNDTEDALASAANYLHALGWDGKRGWGREVALPPNFDVGLASIDSSASETVKPLSEWAALGITQADGSRLPKQDIVAALVLPAGAEGPAFLVYENYRAILKWNRSTFYAIAVGHLADRLSDGPALVALHHAEIPLQRADVMALQDGLFRLGYLKDKPDGVVGGGTRQALRTFQRANGFTPDGYANRVMVQAVVAQAGIAPGS